jgi:ATP-dependent DNA helicase RecG
MRPAILDPLFAPLTSLKGIGPKLAKPFGRLLDRPEPRVIDILFHLPHSAIDRRARPKLGEVQPDTIATVKVTVERHLPGRGRAPYKIVASDDTNTIEIVYFNVPRERIEKMLPVGAIRYLSGRVGLYDGRLQMVHPDRVLDEKGCATCRNGRTPPSFRRVSFCRSPRPFACRMDRASLRIRRQSRGCGRGSPMTSCSHTN